MEAGKDNVIERFQGEEPEVFDVEQITGFDSFAERLAEAEQDYREACEEFLQAHPGKESIMAAAEETEKAARTLYSRVQVIFLMPKATEADIAHAHEILDILSKDSCARERTCSQYYRKLREAHPEQKERISRVRKEKQKRMKFLDRCLATQAHYLKKQKKEQKGADPILEAETRASARAARIRQYIPEGGRFCPPHIFPHDPIPWGSPVPPAPEVYRRFKKIDPRELDFNMEHCNFELRPDYISEDGLLDGQSVVWDYEKHKVTMKYRGGVPVTWDFKQYIDRREVMNPADWSVQYDMRIWDQELYEPEPGLLEHRPQEEEPPEYDRIPMQNEK